MPGRAALVGGGAKTERRTKRFIVDASRQSNVRAELAPVEVVDDGQDDIAKPAL